MIEGSLSCEGRLRRPDGKADYILIFILMFFGSWEVDQSEAAEQQHLEVFFYNKIMKIYGEIFRGFWKSKKSCSSSRVVVVVGMNEWFELVVQL